MINKKETIGLLQQSFFDSLKNKKTYYLLAMIFVYNIVFSLILKIFFNWYEPTFFQILVSSIGLIGYGILLFYAIGKFISEIPGIKENQITLRTCILKHLKHLIVFCIFSVISLCAFFLITYLFFLMVVWTIISNLAMVIFSIILIVSIIYLIPVYFLGLTKYIAGNQGIQEIGLIKTIKNNIKFVSKNKLKVFFLSIISYIILILFYLPSVFGIWYLGNYRTIIMFISFPSYILIILIPNLISIFCYMCLIRFYINYIKKDID